MFFFFKPDISQRQTLSRREPDIPKYSVVSSLSQENFCSSQLSSAARWAATASQPFMALAVNYLCFNLPSQLLLITILGGLIILGDLSVPHLPTKKIHRDAEGQRASHTGRACQLRWLSPSSDCGLLPARHYRPQAKEEVPRSPGHG